MEVRRTVERDGKPLTTDEQRKEDERQQKAVEKTLAERARNAGKPAKPDNTVPLSRLLELGSFSAPRREMVAGRPTIAVDFVGNPNAKTRNENEKAIHQVAGTLWIDETDHTVQHIEARLLNDFRVAGGMVANVGKGTTFSLQKHRVNDELWVEDSLDVRGHFRMLLLLASDAHIHVSSTDFRKLRASATILPGMAVIPKEGDDVPQPSAEPK